MLNKYTTEEYRKLYRELPEKIKDLFWEDDIGDRIGKIVDRHELSDVKEKKVIRLVAHIFLGLLPPKNLKKTVLEEIDANPDDAKRIIADIKRLIIFPTKHLLKEIYEEEGDEGKGTFSSQKGEPGDAYREPIE